MALSSLAIFMIIWLITAVKYSGGGFTFDLQAVEEIAPYGLLMFIQFIAFIVGRYKPAATLVIFTSVNILLLLCGMIAPPQVAFWAVIGTGLFFSIGWTNIFSLAIRGLGAQTGQASALLVMAVAGGAILPLLQAWVYHHTEWGIRGSFMVPAIGLLTLIGFGLYGYKTTSSRTLAGIEGEYDD
jgi:FHS family L-fucose permease-like MFS transporter